MSSIDVRRKLAVLADAAKYDASCASSDVAQTPPGVRSARVGIVYSYGREGRTVALLKVLLTNHCVYDCAFCVHRASNDTRRARFAIDELVELVLELYRSDEIEGLFLSSGVDESVDHTVEQMVEVARRLRQEHGFAGQIHLKLIAGASQALVEQAGRWADRLSTNVELTSEDDLATLAPQKSHAAADATMAFVRERIDEAAEAQQKSALAPRFASGGQSTQLVVGVTAATDRALLATAERLYRMHDLRRIYFAAYVPIATQDARLPREAPPVAREQRLYQADWLVRFGGFPAEELTTDAAPNLDLELDPKLVWALRHRELFPVDLNRATRAELLRVPGLGGTAVDRLMRLRKWRAITLADLAKLKVPRDKVEPFVVTRDHCPTQLLDSAQLEASFRRRGQLGLFDS